MDSAIAWSPEALEDVEAIADYIARDSVFYAAAIVEQIINTTRTLPDFPKIGRRVPELNNETIRERFVYSYRLIYQLRPDDILIIAVIHGKRQLDPVVDRIKNPT